MSSHETVDLWRVFCKLTPINVFSPYKQVSVRNRDHE